MAEKPRPFSDSPLEDGASQYPTNHTLDGGDHAEQTEHQETEKDSDEKDQNKDASLSMKKRKRAEAESDTEPIEKPRSDDDGRKALKLFGVQIYADEVNSKKLGATSGSLGRDVENDKPAQRQNSRQGDEFRQRKGSRAGARIKGGRSHRTPNKPARNGDDQWGIEPGRVMMLPCRVGQY